MAEVPFDRFKGAVMATDGDGMRARMALSRWPCIATEGLSPSTVSELADKSPGALRGMRVPTKLSTLPDGWLSAFGMELAEDVGRALEVVNSPGSIPVSLTSASMRGGRLQLDFSRPDRTLALLGLVYGFASERVCAICGSPWCVRRSARGGVPLCGNHAGRMTMRGLPDEVSGWSDVSIPKDGSLTLAEALGDVEERVGPIEARRVMERIAAEEDE